MSQPHIYRSPLKDIQPGPPFDIKISQFVLGHARKFGKKTAIIDVDPETLNARMVSYDTLVTLVHKLALSLVQLHGVKKGDVVAIYAHNALEYPIVFHSIGLIGAIVTTINPAYTVRELESQLRNSGATYIFFSPTKDVTSKTKEAASLLKPKQPLKGLFVMTPLKLHSFPSHTTSNHGEGSLSSGHREYDSDISLLSEMIDNQSQLFELPPKDPHFDNRTEVALLPFSSGTTGLSKGVMLTHYNVLFNLLQTAAVEDLNQTTTITAFLPMFHIYGMAQFMCNAFWRGATIVTMSRFEFAPLLDSIQRYKITRAYVVPPIVVLLAKSPLVQHYDLSSLQVIHSAAAPLTSEIEDACRARLPKCKLKQAYGMTELSPVSHFNMDHNIRRGAVGILVPNTEGRIVDPETGKDCGEGVDGELWLRGPQVMKGYLNNPEATSQTIVEGGWLRTGDIGHVDKDGFYFIVDRIKDLIKFKGFQVVPAELEGLILSHPLVADVAVVGKKDEKAGEVPKALVVLKSGANLTEQELKDYVAKNVAHFKRIQEVEFVDEIPKTPSGKILRRLLKDREVQKPSGTTPRPPSSVHSSTSSSVNPFRSRL